MKRNKWYYFKETLIIWSIISFSSILLIFCIFSLFYTLDNIRCRFEGNQVKKIMESENK